VKNVALTPGAPSSTAAGARCFLDALQVCPRGRARALVRASPSSRSSPERHAGVLVAQPAARRNPRASPREFPQGTTRSTDRIATCATETTGSRSATPAPQRTSRAARRPSRRTTPREPRRPRGTAARWPRSRPRAHRRNPPWRRGRSPARQVEAASAPARPLGASTVGRRTTTTMHPHAAPGTASSADPATTWHPRAGAAAPPPPAMPRSAAWARRQVGATGSRFRLEAVIQGTTRADPRAPRPGRRGGVTEPTLAPPATASSLAETVGPRATSARTSASARTYATA
jgi:hypothetical protein